MLKLTLRGNLLLASVQGRGDQPCNVTVALAGDDWLTAACSCPYRDRFGGYCKHIAAAVLELHHKPGNVVHEASIAELLGPLNADTLRGVLESLLRSYPDTRKDSAPPAEATFGTRLYEQMMRSAVRSAVRDWDDFPEYDEVCTVIEEIKPFLERGAYRDALALAEALTHALIAEVSGIDDLYEGIGFSDKEVFSALDTHLTKAVLGARLTGALTEAESKRLLYDVLAWNDISNEWTSPNFNMVSHAVVAAFGEDEEAQLSREVADLPIHRGTFDEIRLRVLRATGQADKALALAQATGQGAAYLTLLFESGQLEVLMQTYREHLTNAEDALKVAEQIAAEHPEAALEVARYGLSLTEPEQTDSFPYITLTHSDSKRRLATFTKDLAFRTGDAVAALEAGVTEFKLEPTLPRYHALRDHAAAGWQDLRVDLLNYLRGASYTQQHAAVDIFLAENLHAEATEIASQSYADERLVQRVMTAVTATHPLWVRGTAERRAAAIREAGTQAYDEAARWLGYAKEAYSASQQDEAWKVYIVDVREKHARKHKLMAALEAL